MPLDPVLHGFGAVADLAEVALNPADYRFAAVAHFAGDVYVLTGAHEGGPPADRLLPK